MPPTANSAWLRTVTVVVAVLAGALVFGVALGQPWPALALAALALLSVQVVRLRTLLSRLDTRRNMPPPGRGRGAWSEIGRLLHRRRQDARARDRRLVEMLRAYRTVASVLPDALVIVDRNSQRLLWSNTAATTLLGLDYPRDQGASISERLQPLPMARWLSAGRHAEPMLDVASPADPALRLSLRLIPYSDALWLLVGRDVGKMVRLEQMRRDFVANVSHELRTPLTVVHGYLDMLDPEDMPGWAPMLAEMQRQSQRMTQLVEDLLTLSRLEAQDVLPDEPVPMASMLATLGREAEALSQGRHVITASDSAGVDLAGSSRELHSAFSNLVANAVRYTPSGGEVAISFRRSADGGVELAVRDTGYGIPAEHLPRLTERFYRVSTSRTRETGGTGLGLAIAKHVLQLHQARLAIESEVGRGSTFTCHFVAARIVARDDDHHGVRRAHEHAP
jgi:two-component system phosphate regulon sensor histidine kinase PhoR